MNKKNTCIIFVLSFTFFMVFLYYIDFAKKIDSHKASSRQYSGDNKLISDHLSDQYPAKDVQRNTVENKADQIKNIIKKGFDSTIDFWGKVVDQDGNPIHGVKCDLDIDAKNGIQKHVVFSDENGLFEIIDQKGASIYVEVSKDGYKPTSDVTIGTDISARMIYYSIDAMPFYSPPAKNAPQLFVLRKKNPIANIAHFVNKGVILDKSGGIKKIKLASKDNLIEIEVRCWSDAPVPFSYKKYNWSAEIRVVGADLQIISDRSVVEAPESGYKPAYKIEMLESNMNSWKATSIRENFFWIKFKDGSFAKACIEIKTGRSHVVDIDIWYNSNKSNNFEI